MIIQLCHFNGGYCKYGVESADTLFLLYFCDLSICRRSNFFDIGELIKHIRLITAVGLLIKVVKYVLGDK